MRSTRLSGSLLLIGLLCATSCREETATPERSFCGHQPMLCERVEGFCSNAASCEAVEMLIAPEECLQQVAESLFEESFRGHTRPELSRVATGTGGADPGPRPRAPSEARDEVRDCWECVTGLTCAGMGKVVGGELTLHQLCPKCSLGLGVDSKRSAYLLVRGLAAKPVPPAAPVEAAPATGGGGGASATELSAAPATAGSRP